MKTIRATLVVEMKVPNSFKIVTAPNDEYLQCIKVGKDFYDLCDMWSKYEPPTEEDTKIGCSGSWVFNPQEADEYPMEGRITMMGATYEEVK